MKYDIILTSTFKKELKLIKKRKKDLDKLTKIVNNLANGEILDEKYKDHQLLNSPRFKNCRECHIEPDWLLVYKKNDNELILFLIKLVHIVIYFKKICNSNFTYLLFYIKGLTYILLSID